MRKFLRIPDDFAEMATHMTVDEAALHYRVNKDIIKRWRKEAGIVKQVGPKVVMPEDFEQNAHMTIEELAFHYPLIPKHYFSSWRKKLGIKARTRSRHTKIPADFAEIAPKITRNQACQRYGVGGKTVRLWEQSTGSFCMSADIARQERAAAKMRPVKLSSAKAEICEKAMSLLRKERWIVFPCNADGAFEHCNTHWRVGRLVLTFEEMILKAKRYDKQGILSDA